MAETYDFSQLFSADHEALTIAAGDAVFSAGEPGDRMYVVKSGRIEIVLDGVVFESVGPGGILGEMALVDSGPRSAGAVAREDSKVVAVDQRTFLYMVQNTPFFALHLLKVFADRLRRMNTRV